MSMKNLCLLLRSPYFNFTRRRTLFNESYLGMDRFNEQKAQESKSSLLRKKFQNVFENENLNIITTDFKKFVFLIDTEKDFIMFSNVFDRYSKQVSTSMNNVKFQIFTLGPVILRVYYAMNKPIEAYNLIKNPNTFSVICNLTALFILQDLLYENAMYEEVCEVFNIIQEKQFLKKTFHFGPYVLCQAACYKMDTPQSYKHVIELYEKFISLNKYPKWPILMYTHMYALKNDPLKIPTKCFVGFDPASVNIKLSELIKSGKYSDALNFFGNLKDKSIITRPVAEDLCKLLKNGGTIHNESQIKMLLELLEEIKNKNSQDKTLDDLAKDVIVSIKVNKTAKPCDYNINIGNNSKPFVLAKI